MKKKYVVFTIIILAAILPAIALANDHHRLYANVAELIMIVNGDEKNFLNPIITINGRTYLPLREAGGILGMEVMWFRENQTIVIQNNQRNDGEESLLSPFEINSGTKELAWGV